MSLCRYVSASLFLLSSGCLADTSIEDEGLQDNRREEQPSQPSEPDPTAVPVAPPASVPRLTTTLRLVNDTGGPIFVQGGCNSETWSNAWVEVESDSVSQDDCDCGRKLDGGSCTQSEAADSCDAYWWTEVPAGDSVETSLSPSRLRRFDELGCYVWEGVDPGGAAATEVCWGFQDGNDDVCVRQPFRYGDEVVEVHVSSPHTLRGEASDACFAPRHRGDLTFHSTMGEGCDCFREGAQAISAVGSDCDALFTCEDGRWTVRDAPKEGAGDSCLQDGA